MAQFRDEIKVAMPVDRTMHLCRQVVAQMGWNVEQEGPNFIWPKQELGASAALFRPVRLAIEVVADSEGSVIVVTGRKSGWNDDMRRIPEHGGTFRSRLLLAIGPSDPSAPEYQSEGSLGSELVLLEGLLLRGTLTAAEFEAAKRRVLERQ